MTNAVRVRAQTVRFAPLPFFSRMECSVSEVIVNKSPLLLTSLFAYAIL